MDSRPRALLVVVVLALALVVSLFAFVDFHAMESNTLADASVGTAQANKATAPVDQPLQLLVLGDGPVADRLSDHLAAELSPTFATINQTDEPIESWNGPVLVVGIVESDVRYNPVTPSAAVTAEFAFVGSGNVTLATQFARGEMPPVLSNLNPYVVQGDVVLQDESRGIVSVPAYERHVTERLATKLGDALTSAPGMP